MGKTIFFILICGALVLASNSLGGQAKEELANYHEVIADPNVQIFDATLTDYRQRDIGTKRNSKIEYCPNFSYDDDGFEREHNGYYLCDESQDNFSAGKVEKLYVSRTHLRSYIYGDTTEEILESSSSNKTWIMYGGIAGIVAGLFLLVVQIKGRKPAHENLPDAELNERVNPEPNSGLNENPLIG